MKERINWADQTRGIGVLLVFSVHFFHGELGTAHLLVQFLSMSCLTVFYFTSGYFFRGSFEFKQWLKHNAYTLLLPYLVASLVFLVFHCIKREPGILDRFLGIFLQLPNTPWEGGRWFVPSFFVAKLVFDFSASRCKGNVAVLLTLCFGYAAASWVYTLLGGPRLPWNIEAALLAQPFFAMGYCWKHGMEQRYEMLTASQKTMILFGAAVAFIALAALNLKLGGRTVDYHSRVLNEFFTAYSASICALFVILQISMKSNRILVYVGRDSLIYYMYTGISGMVTSRIMKMLGWNHWAVRFLIGVIGLVLLITPMALVMNRYFPWAAGKRKLKNV